MGKADGFGVPALQGRRAGSQYFWLLGKDSVWAQLRDVATELAPTETPSGVPFCMVIWVSPRGGEIGLSWGFSASLAKAAGALRRLSSI